MSTRLRNAVWVLHAYYEQSKRFQRIDRIMNNAMNKARGFQRENVGGSEKSRLVVISGASLFKRVLRGYDERAGCPLA